MSKQETKDLLEFLQPFGKDIPELALWLRDFVWDMYPTANELVFDSYNALAFGWSLTEKQSHGFCNIAIGRTSRNVFFGFYWGSEIADPEKMLLGEGKQFRYMIVKDKKTFPKAYIKKLIKEAYANSLAKVKDPKLLVQGKTIVKMMSDKKQEKKSDAVKNRK